MRLLRLAAQRFHTLLDWLDSRHTFSFGGHLDPQWMGFGSLRVLNDDRVAPGRGFPGHPHRDMEIVTYVLEGALEHTDSMGHTSVLRAGELQRMSAGTGIRHSEMNASPTEPVHFLQIWIEPERPGLEPSYEQRAFAGDGLQVVASPDGRDGSLRIHRDASILLGNLGSGDRAEHALEAGRGLWIHVATGAVAVDGEHLEAGDGLGIRAEECIALIAEEEARVLLFDLGS